MTSPPTETEQLSIPHLEAFFQGVRSCQPPRPPESAVERPALTAFFDEAAGIIERAELRRRDADRISASRFNVLALIEPNENKLSDLLADLLDPSGNHGQGYRFLALFLERLKLPSTPSVLEGVKVIREAPTHGIEKFKRRIDILIQGRVLVAIENKIDAAEQHEQVRDYLEHLRVISRQWSIPAALVYLTPDGRPPNHLTRDECLELRTNGRLHCWSYPRHFRAWLESCVEICEADKIRHYLGDFIAYIGTNLTRPALEHLGEE